MLSGLLGPLLDSVCIRLGALKGKLSKAYLPPYDCFKRRALSIFQTGSRPLWTLSPPFPSILPHEKQERWFLETNKSRFKFQAY